MKKLLAIVLCLAMLVSVVVVSASAANEKKSLIDVLAPYGVKPTYCADSVTTAPVIDGSIYNEAGNPEYTVVREFTNLTDPYAGLTFDQYADNHNFGGNCWPNNRVTVKECVAQDDEYIYLAFEFGQDLKDFMIRFNLAQDSMYDMAAHKHKQELAYDIPEGVDLDDKAKSRWYDEFDVAGRNYFSRLTDGDNLATPEVEGDDYDGIVKRNFDDAGEFLNITAEFRISKAAILAKTKDTADTEVKYFGYNVKGKRTEAGAGIPEGSDVTLQWTVPATAIMMDGYTSGTEYMAENYPDTAAQEYLAGRAGQMLRYICFFEDPDPTVSDTSANGTTIAGGSTAEPTTAEGTTAEPTTAEATTAKPSATKPTVNTEATTAAATTAATTAAEEKGCGKSIALSALAIVPVLGLGVAVVSKKKED